MIILNFVFGPLPTRILVIIFKFNSCITVQDRAIKIDKKISGVDNLLTIKWSR